MLTLEVAAALILRQGKYLITRRTAHQHLAGYWEFPGGKRHRGETWKRCLARELHEELGIEVRVGSRVQVIQHAYDEKKLRIAFYDCFILRGTPHPREGQPIRWVSPRQLGRLPFPEADQKIIQLLTAPRG